MRELLQGIISIIVLICSVIMLALGISLFFDGLANKQDTKLWNDGHCDICGGTWQYEQAVGHRSTTSYIYVCDGCGKRIEINEVR